MNALSADAQFSGKAREAIEALEDLGDPDSMNIRTEVSRGVDQWLWFVEAHQQTRPVSTGAGARVGSALRGPGSGAGRGPERCMLGVRTPL